MTQMDAPTDMRLLREFAGAKSGAAFAELVDRHAKWLFAAALRQLRDPHLAEDAVQTVFLLLARKAPDMHDHPKLSGWLFNTLHYTVCAIRRNEQRRQAREREAARRIDNPGEQRCSPELIEALDEAVR